MIHVDLSALPENATDLTSAGVRIRIRILSDATQTTIVLYDGAGSSPYGGIAAC